MTNKPANMPAASQTQAVAKRHPKHLEVMADRLRTDPAQLYKTLKATVFRAATDDEFVSLLIVANQYELDPLLKQIYAFPQKGGGIAPIVSIDGWVRIINRQPDLDGIEFEWEWTDKENAVPFSCTCAIYIKNRTRPTKVTEYFEECQRNTEPWKQMKCRMLRHKALIQCGRVAFGLSGIFDEDEAKDVLINAGPAGAPPPSFMGPGTVTDVTPVTESVPHGTTETERPTTEPQDDDAPPGAEVPAKGSKSTQERSEPSMGSQPTQEAGKQPTEAAKAQERGFVSVPAEVAIDFTGEKLLATIRDTLKVSGCTEEQLTAWALKTPGMLKAGQKHWTEMSETKLKNVLTKWAGVGPVVATL
jgi:phage recombination protein Bet